MAAQATLARTQTAHRPKTIPKAAPGFTLRGFAAAKPIAISTRHQIQKSSNDPPRASKVFGAVSGKYALSDVATIFSGSTSPYVFSGKMIIARMLVIAEGKNACVVIANDWPYRTPAPLIKLKATR